MSGAPQCPGDLARALARTQRDCAQTRQHLPGIARPASKHSRAPRGISACPSDRGRVLALPSPSCAPRAWLRHQGGRVCTEGLIGRASPGSRDHPGRGFARFRPNPVPDRRSSAPVPLQRPGGPPDPRVALSRSNCRASYQAEPRSATKSPCWCYGGWLRAAWGAWAELCRVDLSPAAQGLLARDELALALRATERDITSWKLLTPPVVSPTFSWNPVPQCRTAFRDLAEGGEKPAAYASLGSAADGRMYGRCTNDPAETPCGTSGNRMPGLCRRRLGRRNRSDR